MLVEIVKILLPLPLIALGVAGTVNPAAGAVAGVIAVVPLLDIFRAPRRKFLLAGPLLLLAAGALMGLWIAYDPALSLPYLMTLLGSLLLFVALSQSTLSPKYLSRGIVIVAALASLYFAGQYAHFNYSSETGSLPDLGRTVSSMLPNLVFFTPHPNAVAGFLEGAFLLGIVLVWQANTRTRQLIWGGVILLITYALLITESRGAWVGLLIAMALWGLLYFGRQAPRLVGVGVGLLGGMLIGISALVALIGPQQDIPVFGSLLNTASSRLTLYQNSFNLLKDYPFTGIGPGDPFAMVYSRYQLLINVPFLYYAHNIFLSVGLGLGLVGLVGLFWLLVSLYLFVIQVEKSGLPKNLLPYFRAAWLGVTIVFIHGLTDSVQFSEARWTMPMLFALLGLTVTAGRPAYSGSMSGIIPRPYHRPLALAALAVVIAGAVIFWRPLLGAWYANLGAVYQTHAELAPNLSEAAQNAALTQAAAYFEQALHLTPQQPTALRRLGMMALDQHQFDQAANYLEQAYLQEPDNQATLKALGYAYLWNDQSDQALALFQQVNFQSRLIDELNYWEWWWGTRDRADLSDVSGEMARRLRQQQS